MSGFSNPIIGGRGALVYPSIHSPNFAHLIIGWSINKDGTAEFTGLLVNGGTLTSIGPLGSAFAQVDIANGQITFGQSSSPAGPFFTDAQIGLTHLQAGPTGQTILDISGGFIVDNGAGGGIAMLTPSGDTTGVLDAASIGLFLALGYTPWLLPGTWFVACGNAALNALGPGQYIIGSGDLNTIINAKGSGDLFRWVHAGSISDGATTGGGLIGGATIDGTACTGVAVGIHAGDINALRFDCRCQHFTKTGGGGTGSWGFLFDNANNFTERMHLNIRAKDCGFAGGDGGMAGFTVSGATTSTASFSRLRGRVEITQGSNQQDGVVLMNGAHIYDHQLEIVGNFQGNAVNPTTAVAMRITGTVPTGHPGAGSRSRISNGRLDIGCECSSAVNAPATLAQQTSSNSVDSCHGNVNWNTNFTASGIAGAGWEYDGQVQGDTSLGTRRYYGDGGVQTITANGQAINSIQTSAKIRVTSAGAFNGLSLSPGNNDGQAIWLVNTGGSALTFAASPGSNLGAGVATVLAAGSKVQLIWDAASALWY